MSNNLENLGVETVFGNIISEEMAYAEPIKEIEEPKQEEVAEDVSEQELVVEDNQEEIITDLKEEKLISALREEQVDVSIPKMPEVNENAIESEVLFTPCLVNVDLDEFNKDPRLEEQDIEYLSPIRPDYISEEVLFAKKDVEEEKPIEAIVEETPEEDSIIEDVCLDEEDEDVEENNKTKRIEKSFSEKMLRSSDVLINRYIELKKYILRFKKVKSRISNSYDSFNHGKEFLFKINVVGKTIRFYLPLAFDEVEAKYFPKNVSDKKTFERVPTMIKIKSDRALKNAKTLVDLVATKYELVENKKYNPDELDVLKELNDKVAEKNITIDNEDNV